MSRVYKQHLKKGILIGGSQSDVSNGLYVSNNAIINKNLTVNQNLIVSGYIQAKPYISLKISTSIYSSGSILAIPSTSSVIGTPGAVTITSNMGFQQNVTVARGTVGNVNQFLYTINFATPHPLGANFAVGCTFNTTATANANPNATFTCNTQANSISVWIRENTTNILRDGNFYVYSIP